MQKEVTGSEKNNYLSGA